MEAASSPLVLSRPVHQFAAAAGSDTLHFLLQNIVLANVVVAIAGSLPDVAGGGGACCCGACPIVLEASPLDRPGDSRRCVPHSPPLHIADPTLDRFARPVV